MNTSSTLNEPVISTGISSIDEALGGFSKGEIALVVGKSASGKTCFAAFLASQFAQQQKNTLYISLEQTASSLRRCFSDQYLADDGIYGDCLSAVNPSKNDIEGIRKAIASAPFPSVDAVIIDYLALVEDDTPKESRVHIMETLSSIARDLNTFMVVIDQAPKAVSAGKPFTADSYETKITDRLDYIFCLWRPGQRIGPLEGVHPDDVMILMEKNRHGNAAMAKVTIGEQGIFV